MRNTRLIPYMLIAPSALFLAALFVYPLIQTIGLALHANGAWSLGNFVRMGEDLDFGDAIGNTFKLVAVVVPVQMVLALTMALMLGRVRCGRDIVLWIWSIPLGISDLAAGLVWLAILTDRGYLNTILFKLGLIVGPSPWLTYETPAALFVAIVVSETWRATAIVFLILVAGVQLIPKEFAEAADVFGASPWQRLTRVTLPLLKSSIQTALILRTVLAFEMFAMVITLGGRNFPVLVSEAFNWQGNQEYGVAAAYASLVMLVSLAATALYLVALRPRPGERA